MLNTMHVTRLRLLHTCPMACILSARPSPMPGPSVHTSNGQASSRHVHVWELSRSLAERCTVRVLAARDCISPVADTHCVRLRLAADAVSPNVVQFVFSLRATASRPSPILAARNYVSPVADAVPMPVFLHAWRACVMCTCGRCLAFSLNVITIPFVFKRVHMHATSHQPFARSCRHDEI